MDNLITAQRSVSSLVRDFEEGNLGIPEIQRDVVWGADQVKGLLDSISRAGSSAAAARGRKGARPGAHCPNNRWQPAVSGPPTTRSRPDSASTRRRLSLRFA
jgi:hypothetical protein